MSKNEITEAGCRILSIYACIGGISALNVPISMYQYSSPPSAWSATAFLPAALLLLVSTFLWFSARRIEHRSKIETPSQESESDLTVYSIQSIIFSALGIYLIVDSIIPVTNLVSLIFSANQNGYFPRFWSQLASLAVRGLLTLGIGLWLILGSKSLRRFKLWLLAIHQKDWQREFQVPPETAYPKVALR